MASSELPKTSGVSPAPEPPRTLRGLGIALLNGWLIFHLFAIVICPASVEPSSRLIQRTFEAVAPYHHALFLNHGFRFFGPEPGPSTLVAYQLESGDGTTKSGRIPNRSIVPRLYYHRHFMLTEFLSNGPENLEPLVARAIARNLCRESGAVRVTLTKVEHIPASMDEIKSGLSLNDPSTFRETLIGTFTPEELRRPIVPAADAASTNIRPDESGSNDPEESHER